MRRHIRDEATFATFGWKWNQIIWTNERAVLLHALGESLETIPQELLDVALTASHP